jgi:hypothetical protein
MYDDDDTTFSLVSTASVTDATSVTTRTELELDHADDDAEAEAGFAGVNDASSDFESGWEVSSGPSTSVPPSVYEDEIAYGRRYHGFRRGIYPMPNDEVERHREETVHALFLQLMVCPDEAGVFLCLLAPCDGGIHRRFLQPCRNDRVLRCSHVLDTRAGIYSIPTLAAIPRRLSILAPELVSSLPS